MVRLGLDVFAREYVRSLGILGDCLRCRSIRWVGLIPETMEAESDASLRVPSRSAPAASGPHSRAEQLLLVFRGSFFYAELWTYDIFNGEYRKFRSDLSLGASTSQIF